MNSVRSGFGQGLLELGQQNDRVLALTADLEGSLKMTDFKSKFPQRFFQLGVAEQNLVGVAAGLALTGWLPIVGSYATFLSRAWEQVRVDVCLNQAKVILAGSHAGLSHPTDGVTAQGTEDIALFKSLPNLKVVVPADYWEARAALLSAANQNQAVYLRLYREKTPLLSDKDEEFEIGKAKVLRPGVNLSIFSAGPILNQVMKAAEKLESVGVNSEVVNLRTVKPIDKQVVIKSVRKTGKALVVEDHQVQGGIGESVAQILGESIPVPLRIIGLNSFGKTAQNYQELLVAYKLDSESLFKQVKVWLEKR